MRNNISPEEKLLRLIKGQKKQETSTDKKLTPAVADLKPSLERPARPLIQKYLSSTYLRKTIWVAFALSVVYLIVSFIYPFIGLNKINLPKVTAKKITEIKQEPKLEVRPYEFYLQGIGNRQIFGRASVQENEKPTGVASIDLIKDYNLVGIISGENPQAVIEDKRTQKNYYVTKGQFIGELKVEDIQEGKIIVGYMGQKFELYL